MTPEQLIALEELGLARAETLMMLVQTGIVIGAFIVALRWKKQALGARKIELAHHLSDKAHIVYHTLLQLRVADSMLMDRKTTTLIERARSLHTRAESELMDLIEAISKADDETSHQRMITAYNGFVLIYGRLRPIRQKIIKGLAISEAEKDFLSNDEKSDFVRTGTLCLSVFKEASNKIIKNA